MDNFINRRRFLKGSGTVAAGAIIEGTILPAFTRGKKGLTDSADPLIGNQDNHKYILWNIGEKDGAANEFALTEKTREEYITLGFSQPEYCYIIGVSGTKDFPGILPGAFDQWAGYGFWAGRALHTLPIYFALKDNSNKKHGKVRLVIDLSSVSSYPLKLREVVKDRFVLRATINDTIIDNTIMLNNINIDSTRTLIYDIPITKLKSGTNKIVLETIDGGWVEFDALTLSSDVKLNQGKLDKNIISSLKWADYSIGERLVLLVESIFKEDATIDIEIGSKHYNKKIESGLQITEFVVDKHIEDRILKIEINKHVVYHDVVIPYPTKVEEVSPIDYVNQFMGTSGSRWMIAPGPWMPNGMVKISPDNQNQGFKSGYDYQVENIAGFSHLHGWTMEGLSMLPVNGILITSSGTEHNSDLGYRSRIDKTKEKAEIGYYSAFLTDYNITAELTATTRASFQRYTFDGQSGSGILVNFKPTSEYSSAITDIYVKRNSNSEVIGWIDMISYTNGSAGNLEYRLNFVMQLSKDFDNIDGWLNNAIIENIVDIMNGDSDRELPGRYNKRPIIGAAGFKINFNTQKDEKILVRTGLSFVNIEQARLNLEKEITEPYQWSFDNVVDAQKATWNETLGRIEINESADYKMKMKFYTNLYRAQCARSIFSDVNGKWTDMFGKEQTTIPGQKMLGGDSFWGWHWDLVQFYNLIAPEVSSNWINTFLEMYDKGGWIPIGNPGLKYAAIMTGNDGLILFPSAYQHNIRDFDMGKALKASIHQLTSQPEVLEGNGPVGSRLLGIYDSLGYIPMERGKTSIALEFAYQDWAIGQFSKMMGDNKHYNFFDKRSNNWRNNFDLTTGYMRPKHIDGSWEEPLNLFSTKYFVEGNAWLYTWFVPHDVPALVEAMGRDEFVNRLNTAMEESEKFNFNALGDNFSKYPINHGNEPNMQACYLFNYAGRPDLTQKWARAIQEKYYGIGVRDAYPGDEDAGQMSAWYVMSCLGLFEMDGGCSSIGPYYEFGSPRFENVTINLSDKYHGNKTLRIIAHNASMKNCYIKRGNWNGEEIKDWKIPINKILSGGTLEFWMESR